MPFGVNAKRNRDEWITKPIKCTSRATPGSVRLRSGEINNHFSLMATNKPTGDGARKGAVKERSQVLNPKTDQYVKRDTETGKFMDVKTSGGKFKGVREEK
jgi:hypothetical protein